MSCTPRWPFSSRALTLFRVHLLLFFSQVSLGSLASCVNALLSLSEIISWMLELLPVALTVRKELLLLFFSGDPAVNNDR